MLFAMGCIAIETTHKQNADGSAVITQKMDLSGYMDYVSSMSSSFNDSTDYMDDFNKMCDDVPEEVQCSVDSTKYTVTMSKNIAAADAFYEFETSGDLLSKKYVLTVEELPNFGDIGDDSGEIPAGKLTDSTNAQSALSMKQYGMTWTYTIEMPGKITSAEGGTIDSKNPNKVTFDIYDLMSKQQKIVVEAESEGLACLPAVVLLFGALGVASVGFFFKH